MWRGAVTLLVVVHFSADGLAIIVASLSVWWRVASRVLAMAATALMLFVAGFYFGHDLLNRTLFWVTPMARDWNLAAQVINWLANREPTEIAVTVAGVVFTLGSPWALRPLRSPGRSRSTDSELTLTMIADQLSTAVRTQWVNEARWRRLYDPYAIPVQWIPTDPDLVVGWPALHRLTTSPGWPPTARDNWASSPDDLRGAGNELIDVLDRVPTHRLVVLGEPGSGKSILLVGLVLDLLERRTAEDPVPIVLPMASWNPVDQDLKTWMEHWLITDKSALSRPAPGRAEVTLARALLDEGLILPVLDGLDEIPAKVRGSAIARINDAMGPGQRLVLASRTDAYLSAVKPADDAGVHLAGAAGIVLCPLDLEVVAEYLRASAGGDSGAARWEALFSAVAGNTQSPVARALITPLMAALARAVYNPRPLENLTGAAEPVELSNTTRFPTSTAIEGYLLDRFVPASYRFDKELPYRTEWTARQAVRWLTYLANELEHHQRTTDLAWWKLPRVVPRSLPPIVIGLVAGVAAAIGFSIPAGKGFDVQHGVGFVVTVLTGLFVRKLIQGKPERHWTRHGGEDLSRGLAGGLIGGLLGAAAGAWVFGHQHASVFLAMALGYGIAAAPFSRIFTSCAASFFGVFVSGISSYWTALHEFGQYRGGITMLTNGVGFGLAAGAAVWLINRSNPAKSMRWSRLGLLCGLVVGVAIGVVTGLQVGPMAGMLVGVVGVVTGGYAGAFLFEVVDTDLTMATTPREVLARDRSSFRAGGLGPGLAIGANTGLAFALFPSATDGLPNGVVLGLGVAIASILGIGLTCGFIRASWGSFVIARIWLAVFGHLPWRLIAFLDDAHHRGVLRQAGAVYQFRHIELQRHLARAHEAEP